MQRHHTRFHLGIFGGSGSGKNTYCEKFLTAAKAQTRFIFDPEEQFANSLGLPICRSPEGIDAAVKTGWVCYDPNDMYPGDPVAGLEFWARYAFDAADLIPGRKFFVVDELGDFITTADVPLSLRIILTKGRRHGLDGVFISRSPNELHNGVRAALSEVVSFCITDDTALEWLKSFGFDPEAIRALVPDYRTSAPGDHWICRNNRGLEERG